MTLRVAVVADGAGFGGAQVYARSLIRHAPAWLAVDLVTTVEHEPHLAPTVERRGGGVRVVASSVRADAAPELTDALRRLRPDLVQVNLVDPTSMLAALDAALDVAPTVATLHMNGAVGGFDVYARLRHLVAVSEPFAELAVRELGMPPERVTHVLNGVDPVDAPMRRPGPVPVVGSLGRLTRQKGFDVLIEAVRLLVARGVALEVVLGGDGRERDVLQRQAAGLPVRFAGFQEGPLPFLTGLDVFCLPSRVEALPLSLLEAVSAGVPAVATDVGDVRLALGQVVTVVPSEDPVALADALSDVLTDPAAARRRAAKGAALQRGALTAQRMAQSAWAAFTG